MNLTLIFGLAVSTSFVSPGMAMVVAGSPDSAISHLGEGMDGVVELWIDASTESRQCSGVLLASGRHVLTAAHCVADAFGHRDVVSLGALFETPDVFALLPGRNVSIYPGYDGNYLDGNDLAIISLSQAAPPGADRYSIYRGSDEVGQTGVLAGYGLTGRGRVDLSFLPDQRRSGLNRIDATGVLANFAAGDDMLLYDFDNGLAANDGFGFIFGLHDLGEGSREVMPAPGDSGGPTFLDGSVAGIHSFGFQLSRTDGATPDIDGVLNESFGEFGADVRLSRYADWIDKHAQVPEPACWTVVAPVIILFVRRVARCRSR